MFVFNLDNSSELNTLKSRWNEKNPFSYGSTKTILDLCNRLDYLRLNRMFVGKHTYMRCRSIGIYK